MAFEDRIVSDVCCLSILVLDSRACAHAAWFDCSALIRLGYVSDWCFLLASLTLQLKDVVLDQIASLIVGTRQAPKADSGLPATQRRATAATVPDVSMVLKDVFRERHSKSSWTLVPSAIRHPLIRLHPPHTTPPGLLPSLRVTRSDTPGRRAQITRAR